MTGGVIFDCDGVLVDSEPVSNAVLAEMLTEAGLPTDRATAMREYMGSSTASVGARAAEQLGRPLPDDFFDEFSRRTEERFRAELRPVPGIAAALDRIEVPVAVASSGSHAKLRLTLGLTGLYERFEGRIFSATEVERGKPAPDLFLHAAARLGLDPGECVVVEDAPRGVQAGVAAGMTVLAYADHARPQDLADAGGHVFTDMAQLPDLVRGATQT